MLCIRSSGRQVDVKRSKQNQLLFQNLVNRYMPYVIDIGTKEEIPMVMNTDLKSMYRFMPKEKF
jgi:hypothetical protein